MYLSAQKLLYKFEFLADDYKCNITTVYGFILEQSRVLPCGVAIDRKSVVI